MGHATHRHSFKSSVISSPSKGHILGSRNTKKGNFRFPEMGTYSVPRNGNLLTNFKLKGPEMGTEYEPISGNRKWLSWISGTTDVTISGTRTEPEWKLGLGGQEVQ